jgi:hypothetical protein
MQRDVAKAWLAFLWERQPHKRIELKHLKNGIESVDHNINRLNIHRLRTIAYQYPNDWTVFQTQQRLLGNFKVEDFQ